VAKAFGSWQKRVLIVAVTPVAESNTSAVAEPVDRMSAASTVSRERVSCTSGSISSLLPTGR
jgi:hypothetical protein